jgi:hypothetical protein
MKIIQDDLCFCIFIAAADWLQSSIVCQVDFCWVNANNFWWVEDGDLPIFNFSPHGFAIYEVWNIQVAFWSFRMIRDLFVRVYRLFAEDIVMLQRNHGLMHKMN